METNLVSIAIRLILQPLNILERLLNAHIPTFIFSAPESDSVPFLDEMLDGSKNASDKKTAAKNSVCQKVAGVNEKQEQKGKPNVEKCRNINVTFVTKMKYL